MERPPFVYPNLPNLPGPAPTPFDLPVSQHRLHLSLERPLRLDPRPGATLATTLRGAFRAAFIHASCLLAPDDRRHARCRAVASGPPCELESGCPVVALHAPRSESQRRDHPSPVIFQQIELAPDLRSIAADLVLWGRAPSRWDAAIWSAVEQAGVKGLLAEGSPVPFRAERRPTFGGMLGQFVDEIRRRVADAAGPLLLEIPVAADVRALDLAAIAGGAAHDLVQWDLHDRGAAEALGKRGCDDLADAARVMAEGALRRVHFTSCLEPDLQSRSEACGGSRGEVRAGSQTERVEIGRRRSRSNRELFSLGGLRQSYRVDLERPSDRKDFLAALPWIAVLTLRGGGGKKSFGLGEVILRAKDGEQIAPRCAP